jgi:8-oxo-dGTP pyrophosphatase MutT (NUDIX family)
MPEKFVFPGGALDNEDAAIPLAAPLSQPCRQRLSLHSDTATPEALAAAAIREVWEETGLRLSTPGGWSDAPPDWVGFATRGERPSADMLRFFFRAVTPPGRSRRFDARFFVADAASAVGDGKTFRDASDELSHLQWVPLRQARALNLAFITELVLAELARHLPSMEAPAGVPFVRNDRIDNQVVWLT